MTLYSNMQICGDARATVERRDGTVWVRVQDGNQSITMEAKHVRALDQALSVFFADEWEATKEADAERWEAKAKPAPAVDAAERVTA